MDTGESLKQQIMHAIRASENIINCLHAGDYEAAKKYDLERASFIRDLSKYKNLDDLVPKYGVQLEKLSDLNTTILTISGKLRDEVLTQIVTEQANRVGHEQYLQHQGL